MMRTRYQKLEARRRDLEDQLVVYALTGRRPPEGLARAHAAARVEAEAARREDARASARSRPLERWFGQPAAG